MDETDYKILQILEADARTPFVNIAKRLSTSEGTVRQRVKRLVDDGIIKQFTIDTTGGGLKALIDVRLQTNFDTSEVARKIMRLSGVKVVYEVSGEDDVVAVADVKDTEELNELVEAVRRMGVASTKTRLILKEH
jgi:DNA-binding Lrp family transcriptional regulator